MKKLWILFLCLIPLCAEATKSNITIADTAVVVAGKVLQVLGRVQAESLYVGNRVVSPVFSSAWTPGRRIKMPYLDVDTLAGGQIATSIFDISTASNFKLAGTAATFSMANLNTLVDSLVSSYAWRSKLSASDGTPNPALSVDAAGNVLIETAQAAGTTSLSLSNSGAAATNNYASLFLKANTATINARSLLQIDGSWSNITDASRTSLVTFSTNVNGAVFSPLSFAGGNVSINETANANSTIGLTINQGANDDEILALKSSDVAHGNTNNTETDTYGEIKKSLATAGGLRINGYAATGITWGGLQLTGANVDRADSTHTTGSSGIVTIIGSQISGTNQAGTGTTNNILTVGNYNLTQFIISGNGTVYQNLADSVFDFYQDKLADDVALISTLDKLHAEMSDKKLIDSEWEDFTKYNEQTLIDIGILGGPITNVDPAHKGLVNTSGLLKLHNGAIRQLGRGVAETEYRVGSVEQRQGTVEQRVAQLEMRELFYSSILGRN